MAFPPVPESPIRQPPSRSSVTPRVGMQLCAHDDDDDDVSVLTFHTMGTKDGSVVSSSSFVKSARENLERMILESQNSGEQDESQNLNLTRISEEAGSQQSSVNSISRSSYKSSSAKSCYEKEKVNTDSYKDCNDDDTISLAESILDSTNKVLSNIGSSPYYAGRSKKPTPLTRESLSPQPSTKQPLSPIQQPNRTNDKGDTAYYSKHVNITKTESILPKKISSDHENKLEVSSNFLSSYFSDENTNPSTTIPSNHKKDDSAITSYEYDGLFKGGSNKTRNNDQNLHKLESETKHLQSLLKERQLETKKASQNLGSSIKKANALLERLSAGRTA